VVTALPVFVLLVPILLGFGERLARLLGLRPGPLVERLSLSFVLSTGAVTLAVFGLAVVHALTRWTCIALAAAMAAAAWGPLRDGFRGRGLLPWRNLVWPAGRLDRLMAAVIGAFLGCGLVMALAPPTGMDTGAYHFTIPKVILQSGGLVPREDIWIHKSGGFYMVYAFAMGLGGEILAKLVGFAMAVAGVGLCAAVSDRLRAGTGRIAAFLLVSTPLSAGYLGYEYLELPILTYLLAALLALLRSAEGRAWTLLACAFTGLGLSAKPSAFAMAVLVPAALGLLLLRERGKGAPAAALSLGVFALTAGFWSIWNYVSTGSILYRYTGTALSSVEVPPAGPLWRSVASQLGTLATSGLYWTDSSGPFILAGVLGFCLFCREGRRLPVLLLGASLLVYVGVLGSLAPLHLGSEFGTRYFAPCLIGFGIPAAAQFAAWAREQTGLLRTAVVIALILPFAPPLVLKAGKSAVAAPAAVGLESRSAYLTKKIETFAACEAVNQAPGAEVKVLFAGARPYYLDRPFVWIPYTGAIPFLRGIESREDFVRRAREQGITHVIHEPAPYWDQRMNYPEVLFAAPFREIRRWPWKQHQWVRLYELERP
jgi:hypothetical protein